MSSLASTATFSTVSCPKAALYYIIHVLLSPNVSNVLILLPDCTLQASKRARVQRVKFSDRLTFISALCAAPIFESFSRVSTHSEREHKKWWLKRSSVGRDGTVENPFCHFSIPWSALTELWNENWQLHNDAGFAAFPSPPSFVGNPLCAVCCHPNRLNLEMQFASDASSGWKSDDSMRLRYLVLCDYDSINVGASRIHCVART